MTFLSVFDGICCAARCSVEKTDTAQLTPYFLYGIIKTRYKTKMKCLDIEKKGWGGNYADLPALWRTAGAKGQDVLL